MPGIMLAVMYGVYAFGYALLRPDKAPPIVDREGGSDVGQPVQWNLAWFLGLPSLLVFVTGAMMHLGIAGSQADYLGSIGAEQEKGILRTNVSEQCKISMIALHGQERWDRSVAAQVQRAQTQSQDTLSQLNDEEFAKARIAFLEQASPVSANVLVVLVLLLLVHTSAFAVRPTYDPRPLMIGGAGIVVAFIVDAFVVTPLLSAGTAALIYLLPFVAIIYGAKHAFVRLGEVDLLRVVFPPLILIVAVLGSILGGVTNPTPAAALGAGGAIMLAAFRKLTEAQDARKRLILMAAFAMVIYLLLGANFDLRTGIDHISFENAVAIVMAVVAYHVAIFGLLFACWVLWRTKVLRPVVRETTKVTAMVFAILIGSQMLNLVVISFGGEEYIQSFLRSFDQEWVVFLIVMVVLFILGFVLDFLEIIYIVIPIVGPVIYGGDLDPRWVTIMIAINLQTSFLTPPFGFALFYLRGVAPPSITTGHIYRGVIPFVIIQVFGLATLWLFPEISTFLPDLLPG
ncbi:MAG: TRAP transporter large permease subunit [Pseudomonadota bacterium]